MTGLANLHVLVVDDNPNMRTIVSTMLRAVGIGRVTEAESGPQALSWLRQSAVDIAIVDFRMPPMDGVALTHHLRHDDGSPNPYLPVIMMTGHSERSRVTGARDAGVTEFVAKPVDSVSLFKRIEAVILRPRAFVRSRDYFGPDRRRLNAADYAGPFRRSTDTEVVIDAEP